MTGESGDTFEREAHDPAARSGMVLITETGEVLRVERVPDEIVAAFEVDVLLGDVQLSGEALRAEGWIVLRVQP